MKYLECLSIVLAVAALIVSITTYMNTLKLEKKRNALESYKELQKFLGLLYAYNDGEIEDFVDDANSDEFKAISVAVANIEIFASGVESDIYDFETFYSIAHGFIDGKLRSRIEYIVNMKSGRNSEYYQNIKHLLKRMDDRTMQGKACV